MTTTGPKSRITSATCLSSGKWRKMGQPAWWALVKEGDDERFLPCFGAEGREILDVACDLPVGSPVRIGYFSRLTGSHGQETVVTTPIPEEWAK